MKRILLMVFRNIILVPYMWCRLCYHASHTEKYTEEEQYSLLKFIVLRANKGGNVRIEPYGTENIPKESGFMFFPNHQGLYDVLAVLEACPMPFSVVAKKEIQNIQFLKQVFACMKAYMLDRDNVRQAMQVIIDVSNEVKNGRNYLIFAEGTRSRRYMACRFGPRPARRPQQTPWTQTASYTAAAQAGLPPVCSLSLFCSCASSCLQFF